MEQVLNDNREIFNFYFRKSSRKEESAGFHNTSREYAYRISSQILDLYRLQEQDGKIIHTELEKIEDIRANSHEPLKNGWSDLARGMLLGLYGENNNGLQTPVIDRDRIIFRQQYWINNGQVGEKNTDELPKIMTEVNPGQIAFRDPNVLFYLASRFYIQDGLEKIFDKLVDDNLFYPDILVRNIPLFSFISEHVLLHYPEKYTNFIFELVDKIGGEVGFETGYEICRDLQAISPLKLVEDWKQIQSDTLNETIDFFPDRHRLFRYKNRPEVISPLILERSLAAESFWEELFNQTRVKNIMEEYFNDNELNPILETAFKERKVIPGLTLIFSHILGLDTDTSKRLAAISHVGWGVIVSYDNILDGHMVRKGVPTDLANSGLPTALDRTMLALGKVLRGSLLIDQDNILIEKFLKMLEDSCRGNLEARSLKWNDDSFWYKVSMQKMISAFSWFPEYIGQKANLGEAGNAFSLFLTNIHTIGQMNNDLEDVEENLGKHERGSDIGRRITLFWKTLIDLPDEIIPPDEKHQIRSFWKSEKPIDKKKILGIGLKYREAVVNELYPGIKELYELALSYLEKGFRNLPLLDETNSRYKPILLTGLNQEWEKFRQYCGISSAREDPVI